MRIALDLSGIHEQTGVRIYATQLLRELQKANLDHEFYAIMRHRDAAIYPVDGYALKSVFMPRGVEGAVPNLAWHWSTFSNLLRSQRIHLVHQLDCNRVYPSFQRPLVVTVHGLIDPSVPGRRHFMRQQYNSVIVPSLLNLATHLISVSNNTKRDLLRYTSVPEEKITVIHEGCILQGTEHIDSVSAKAILQKEYGLQENFILYVARLEHPNKNHISLLEAYATLCREGFKLPRLVFVGGDSYRSDVVKQTVNTFSLADQVTITGFVPDEHLPAFYRCAYVYACPTMYEGFGLPLIEAMQFGIPIICSDTSSLPELVGAAAIKFDPGDVPSIASALRSVLSDRELRAKLTAEGFAQVRRFSTSEMAKKTLEVYEGTALRGATRAPSARSLT